MIPGQVRFTLDIRSASDRDRRELTGDIQRLILRESGGRAEIVQGLNVAAVPMNPGMAAQMEGLCREKHISYEVMPSGAGHDAQIFAGYLDTAMLFIPNRDGVSHSPEEYARTEDIERAVEVVAACLDTLAPE